MKLTKLKPKRTNQNEVSIKDRYADISDMIQIFQEHLLSPRPLGSVLSNLECFGIAKCAREAVFCKVCDELPASVCWRPGTDFYAWMNDRNFSIPLEFDDKEKGAFITRTVHAIIRHQHRLDKNWYQCTKKRIIEIFLSDKISMENADDEATVMRCHQIFCEILCIALTSSMIQTIYLGLGEKVPDVLDMDGTKKIQSMSSKEETEFNLSSLLKRVRWDKSISDFSPFFTKEDINMNSSEYKNLHESDKYFLKQASGKKFHPRLAVIFAITDSRVMTECLEIVECLGYSECDIDV